jgi:hypothetical protein
VEATTELGESLAMCDSCRAPAPGAQTTCVMCIIHNYLILLKKQGVYIFENTPRGEYQPMSFGEKNMERGREKGENEKKEERGTKMENGERKKRENRK